MRHGGGFPLIQKASLPMNLGLPPTGPSAIPLGADAKKLHWGGGGGVNPHDVVVCIDLKNISVFTSQPFIVRKEKGQQS